MANVGISARLSADATPFEDALRRTETSARAWGLRMSGISRQTAAAASGANYAGGRGQGLLQLTYAVDDLQYGLRGLTNNLAPIISGMGMGGGVAFVATLAAVAVTKLGTAFMDFVNNTKGVKEATDAVAKLDERLKEAAKKSGKEALEGTAEAAERLKKATQAADAAQARGNTLSGRLSEEESLKEQIRLSQQRFEAAKKFRDQEKLRAEEARKAYEGMAWDSQAAPELRTQNYDRMQAAQIDAEKAQNELNRIDEKGVVEQMMLQHKLHELKKQLADDEEKRRVDAFMREMDDYNERKRAIEEINAAESEQYDKILKLQRAYDKEAEALKRINEEHQKNLGHLETEARIKKLREQGRDVAANKLEHEQNVNDRAEQIQRDTGVSPERARELAEDLEGREGKRINAKSRRHIKAGGIDAFRDLPPIGGPTRNQSRSSRSTEQVQETPKAGDIASLLKKQGETLTEIAANTAGLAKGKSEPLRRTA